MQSRSFSLHIGLNYLNSNHYGDFGRLYGCVNDAEFYFSLAGKMNFNNSILLLNENATISLVKGALYKFVNELNDNDLLFISYSGHGGQIPDLGTDENDKMDESWCLYDAQILDDELFDIYSLMTPKAKIFIISDSCYSGDVVRNHFLNNKQNIRALSRDQCDRIYFKNKDFYRKYLKEFRQQYTRPVKTSPSIKLWAACKENEVAFDNSYHGCFTEVIKNLLNSKSDYTYAELFRDIYNSDLIKLQNPVEQIFGLNLINSENIFLR